MANREIDHSDLWPAEPAATTSAARSAPRRRARRTLGDDLRRAVALARRVPRSRTVLLMISGAALGLSLGYLGRGVGPQLEAAGPAQDAFIGPSALDRLRVQVSSSNARLLDGATLSLDGGDITDDSRTAKGGLLFRPGTLAEGRHTVSLTINQPLLPWSDRRTWSFTIDQTQPRIAVTSGLSGNRRWAPVTITGTVSEPARLLVDDRPVPLRDGRFRVTMATPPLQPVQIRAIDRAGNSSVLPAVVQVTPRAPAAPVRAAHVSAIAWANANVRAAIFRQFERGTLTAVELDLKDERGTVGYDSAVPLARKIGAVRPQYDLVDAVREIHARGGRVIGRQVVFRDPELAAWSWANGKRDMVVQTTGGFPWSGGSFTNLANPTVRKYNVDIATEAARAGVDEVLFDYVRRPDGPVDSMRFPGLPDAPSDEIIRFLQQTQLALKPSGALLGASIFGIAAGRRGPDEIAQDVPRMARYLDVVAPMVYPAGWARGEYGVENPEAQPGEIVERVLAKFKEQTAGTGARLVPWLQDYSKAVPYTGAQVREQIEAGRRLGIEEFMLWNPYVEYHFDGIDPSAPTLPPAAEPTTTASPAGDGGTETSADVGIDTAPVVIAP